MSKLAEQLKTYADSDYLPMHMPGHKRRMGDLGNPFFIDITEIDGFDDLHHAEGILREAENRAANLYGSEETHFLINGSTGGILSAVAGCVPQGGTLLMARNCHKSVYHAALLGNLKTHYIYPQPADQMLINGPILASDVEKELKQHQDIQAVFLTSPTYDGVVSDVRAIAEVVHKKNLPLIVDEAHGAHFPFSSYFPEDSIKSGADVVIHSVHKTLPSLTQTALIHLNGNLVDRQKLRYFLSVYQTSSPSYVLMAGIDQCMEWTASHLAEFDAFGERLDRFRDRIQNLQAVKLLEVPGMDRSKILLSAAGRGVTGQDLAELLRKRWKIEMEMACSTYACAITTVADREEDLCRFAEALEELDRILEACPEQRLKEREMDTVIPTGQIFRIAQAFQRETCEREIKNAEGAVSGGFVMPYPPGAPLLVPGERINRKVLDRLMVYLEEGLTVYGVHKGKIELLKE